MRTGLVAEKVGMSTLFTASGKVEAVTLLRLPETHVVAQRSVEKNGYVAVQIGVGNIKPKNVTKPLKGYYAKANVKPHRKLCEFRVTTEALLNVGTELTVNHFVAGQYVDIQGQTTGKGFAGVMKRWNFRGLRASHGVSVSHRSHGSTGQRQDPGKVMKGKKMAGHMGTEIRTTQNLKILAVDADKNLIVIKGAVPGHDGSFVVITDALKKALPKTAPFPTFFVPEIDNSAENRGVENSGVESNANTAADNVAQGDTNNES